MAPDDAPTHSPTNRAHACRVWVVRHGEAAPTSDSGRDVDRELTGTGRTQAGHLAERLGNSIHPPTVLLTSPVRRARHTAGILGDALGLDPDETADLGLDTAVSDVIDLVAERAARGGLDTGTGVIVGHNPTLETFVAVLVEGLQARPRALRTGEGVLVRFDPTDPIGSGEVLERHRFG